MRSVNILRSVIFFLLRNDGTEFGGSIYQKVNDKLETAVNLAWTAGNSNTRFGIAAKYQIDPDASFSVSSVLPKNEYCADREFTDPFQKFMLVCFYS